MNDNWNLIVAGGIILIGLIGFVLATIQRIIDERAPDRYPGEARGRKVELWPRSPSGRALYERAYPTVTAAEYDNATAEYFRDVAGTLMSAEDDKRIGASA